MMEILDILHATLIIVIYTIYHKQGKIHWAKLSQF